MNKIIFGDCRDTMRDLTKNKVKVQMCVTSPPYFGLRDYGHDSQIGLEETPEQYIEAMVEVFRCVKDILADDGTSEANARLIAAAPELLEALKHAENALADYVPTIEKTGAALNYGHHVIKMARAAIAKATGEQA